MKEVDNDVEQAEVQDCSTALSTSSTWVRVSYLFAFKMFISHSMIYHQDLDYFVDLEC